VKPIAIWGFGGQAKIVADALLSRGLRSAGFIVPDGHAVLVHGMTPLADERALDDPRFLAEYDVVAATGNGAVRRRIAEKVVANGGRLATVVHAAAIVSPSAVIGAGTMLMAGSVVAADARLGRFCIVNTGATVDHDDMLEDGVNVSPGAHLAGFVTCREDAFIGIGAAVIQGITIGRGAIVGAGAAVIHDVPDGVTVVGTPARPLAKRS
jgi:sugar O-acyltransferase (sialic acid O-acetyltransferase NeuD family)